MTFPQFHILYQNGRQRCGVIQTAHGAIQTPCFLFCATKASLKSLSMDQVDACQTQALLSNTYHLMIQPGSDIIKQQGGLHRFMGWQRPIFTDSGGYQIFSLHYGSVSQEIKGHRYELEHKKGFGVKITEEGALFRSQTDGTRHLLSPEHSIHIQCDLRSDLVFVLDECTSLSMTKDQTYRSMARSHRWEKRSLQAFERKCMPHQGLYGIVQGGIYPDFRSESADFVSSQPFFGHAIGGSLGACKTQMDSVIDMALSDPRILAKPIHLLGIGVVEDIFMGVKKGIDTFDCVAPTRLARHGSALVQPHVFTNEDSAPRQHINLKNQRFKNDSRPIQEDCPCPTCQRCSRAYLHHLIKAKEISALSALTMHNMVFMNRLMADVRKGISEDTLAEVEQRWRIFEDLHPVQDS